MILKIKIIKRVFTSLKIMKIREKEVNSIYTQLLEVNNKFENI